MGKRNNGLDNRPRTFFSTHAVYEGLVNLQGVDGELLQIGQGGLACTEIIQGGPNAHGPQGIQFFNF